MFIGMMTAQHSTENAHMHISQATFKDLLDDLDVKSLDDFLEKLSDSSLDSYDIGEHLEASGAASCLPGDSLESDEMPQDIRAFFGHPLNGDDTQASALALLHEFQNLPAIDKNDIKIGDKYGSLIDILRNDPCKKDRCSLTNRVPLEEDDQDSNNNTSSHISPHSQGRSTNEDQHSPAAENNVSKDDEYASILMMSSENPVTEFLGGEHQHGGDSVDDELTSQLLNIQQEQHHQPLTPTSDASDTVKGSPNANRPPDLLEQAMQSEGVNLETSEAMVLGIKSDHSFDNDGDEEDLIPKNIVASTSLLTMNPEDVQSSLNSTQDNISSNEISNTLSTSQVTNSKKKSRRKSNKVSRRLPARTDQPSVSYCPPVEVKSTTAPSSAHLLYNTLSQNTSGTDSLPHMIQYNTDIKCEQLPPETKTERQVQQQMHLLTEAQQQSPHLSYKNEDKNTDYPPGTALQQQIIAIQNVPTKEVKPAVSLTQTSISASLPHVQHVHPAMLRPPHSMPPMPLPYLGIPPPLPRHVVPRSQTPGSSESTSAPPLMYPTQTSLQAPVSTHALTTVHTSMSQASVSMPVSSGFPLHAQGKIVPSTRPSSLPIMPPSPALVSPLPSPATQDPSSNVIPLPMLPMPPGVPCSTPYVLVGPGQEIPPGYVQVPPPPHLRHAIPGPPLMHIPMSQTENRVPHLMPYGPPMILPPRPCTIPPGQTVQDASTIRPGNDPRGSSTTFSQSVAQDNGISSIANITSVTTTTPSSVAKSLPPAQSLKVASGHNVTASTNITPLPPPHHFFTPIQPPTVRHTPTTSESSLPSTTSSSANAGIVFSGDLAERQAVISESKPNQDRVAAAAQDSAHLFYPTGFLPHTSNVSSAPPPLVPLSQLHHTATQEHHLNSSLPQSYSTVDAKAPLQATDLPLNKTAISSEATKKALSEKIKRNQLQKQSYGHEAEALTESDDTGNREPKTERNTPVGSGHSTPGTPVLSAPVTPVQSNINSAQAKHLVNNMSPAQQMLHTPTSIGSMLPQGYQPCPPPVSSPGSSPAVKMYDQWQHHTPQPHVPLLPSSEPSLQGPMQLPVRLPSNAPLTSGKPLVISPAAGQSSVSVKKVTSTANKDLASNSASPVPIAPPMGLYSQNAVGIPVPPSYDLRSPDSGYNEALISPAEHAHVVQSSQCETIPSGDCSGEESESVLGKRRRSSTSMKPTGVMTAVPPPKSNSIVIPKLEPDVSGYQYYLDTNISTTQRIDEDRITYLNKGQFYGLVLEYKPTVRTLRCSTVKSIIMVVFREERSVQDELKAWHFWYSRQHSIKMRILDIDTKNSEGVVANCIEEIAHNAVAIRWNPLEQPAKINIAINCLSTDFSNQKGVKGLPLHIQVDTFEDMTSPTPIHRGYCQVKVFCDKGAERKTRDEERRKDKQKPGETGTRRRTDEFFHPPMERSEFYAMAELNKPPVFFTPVADAGELTSKTSPLDVTMYNGSASVGLVDESTYVGPAAKRARSSSSGSSQGDKVLLYVREVHETVFTALLLHHPSLPGLADAIEEKYDIAASKIRHVYKRSRKGILVKMDDNILRHYSNESAFIISMQTVETHPAIDPCYDVTLAEIDVELK